MAKILYNDVIKLIATALWLFATVEYPLLILVPTVFIVMVLIWSDEGVQYLEDSTT